MVLYALNSRAYHGKIIKINKELWNANTLPKSEQDALDAWLSKNLPKPDEKIWDNI